MVFAISLLTLAPGYLTPLTFARIPNAEGLPAPHPYALSADGRTVVGQYAPGNPFIWRGGETAKFRPVSDPNVLDIYAQAVNRDGTVVVGKADGGYVYTRGKTSRSIKPLPGHIDSFAYGVSDDGKVVTGYSESGRQTHGFVWTFATGTQAIVAPNQQDSVLPYAISGDGKIVTGIHTSKGDVRAFTYTNKTFNFLDIPAPFTDSSAFAISRKGTTIAGLASTLESSNAVIWVNGKMRKLSNFGVTQSGARCITADGTYVGGYVGDDAAIWSSDGKGILLKNLVKGASEWKLETVTGISRVGDKVMICGWGHLGKKDASFYATFRAN
jgi:probable HAF family extracellular repeat protein